MSAGFAGRSSTRSVVAAAFVLATVCVCLYASWARHSLLHTTAQQLHWIGGNRTAFLQHTTCDQWLASTVQRGACVQMQVCDCERTSVGIQGSCSTLQYQL
jgi:hypothetical protein